MNTYLMKNVIVWGPGKNEEDAIERLRAYLQRNGYTWNDEPLPDDPPVTAEEWDDTK